MDRMIVKVLLLLIFSIGISVSDCIAQKGNVSRKYGSGLITKSKSHKVASSSKKTRVKEPEKVIRAKKEQEKKEKRLKKDNEKAVAAAKQRHFSIQSESVQERMKQNAKENVVRDKERKKNVRKASRPAARKYKTIGLWKTKGVLAI